MFVFVFVRNAFCVQLRIQKEKLDLSAREIQFVWHVLPSIQIHLNGPDPQLFEERIIFLSMFNSIAWTEKRHEERCLRNAREVAEFSAKIRPGRFFWEGPAPDDTL